MRPEGNSYQQSALSYQLKIAPTYLQWLRADS
jgi:hypothetical protein